MGDRELDALVAEKVFAINLKPSRDLALAKVGIRYISSTGEPFTLIDGREVAMRGPGCGPLVKPEDSTDWNDRYYRRVGEFLAESASAAERAAIAAEVDAYRLPARPYSTDIAVAFLVVEEMRKRGWLVELITYPVALGDGQQTGARFSRYAPDVAGYAEQTTWYIDRAPRAICVGALRALKVEVEL